MDVRVQFSRGSVTVYLIDTCSREREGRGQQMKEKQQEGKG